MKIHKDTAEVGRNTNTNKYRRNKEVWPNKKHIALALSFMIVLGFGLSINPVTEKVSFVGDASASALGDNITTTLNEFLPLVILIGFVVAILAMLGMKRLMK